MKKKLFNLLKATTIAFLVFFAANVSFAQNTLDNLGYSSSDPKAEAAYSLRLLSTSYTGPLVRITISGNTYDVWADATGSFSMSSVISSANPATIPGSKNGTALSTVATGNTATISIWYDQTGLTYNSGTITNNAVQGNTSQQPRIINAGVIDMQRGVPSAYFNGGQQLLGGTHGFFNFGGGASILSVWNFTGTGTSGLFTLNEVASSNFLNITTLSTNSMRFESGVNGGNIQTTVQNIANNNLYQQSCTGIVQRLNGTNPLTGGNTGLMTSAFTSQFQIGAYTQYWTGYASEIICFPSTLSSSVSKIGENNQIAYYRTVQTPPGNALNFNGVNDYVSTPSTTIGNFGTSAFTIETWIRTTQSTLHPTIVNKRNVCNGVGFWNCGLINGKLEMEVGEAAGFVNYYVIDGTISVSDGKWHHIAYTRSVAGLLSLYVDGILDVTATPTAIASINNNFPIKIASSICGNNGYIANLNGSLDEMRIWTVERTQAQLQASMYNVISASSSNLIAYYNFDNGVAGANNTGVTTLVDLTSNANNGTVTNLSLTGSTSNWVESYAMVVPTATAATSVAASGFTANWTAPAIGTVDNYLLDVSTSSTFSSFVSGYNGLSVTGTSQSVTGLTQGTTYYYRVHTNKASVANQGGYSSIISATTCVNTTSTTNLSICTSALPFSWNGLMFNAAGSQTYHTTNATGCDSAATLNITVKANYTITASAASNGSISNSGVSTICNGDNSATYTITTNSGYHIADVLVDGISQGAVTAYTFNNVTTNHTISASFAANCTPTSSTVNTSICPGGNYVFNGVTYTTAGSHTATFTNVGGCDSMVTVNISISTATTPSVSIAVSQNNVCVGTAITFTATPVNGGASPSFVWKKNGSTVVGATSSSYIFIAGTLANNDTISCVMTANNTCQTTAIASSNKVVMTLKTAPNIGTSVGGTICTIGGSLTLYNTNTQGGGIWSTGDSSIATVTTISGANAALVATGAGTVTMTYTKTSSNGCKSIAVAAVIVAPVAAPAAIGSPALGICKGASTTLTNATPNGVWSSSASSIATIDSVTGVVLGKYQGTTTIRYTIKNAYGCTNAATVTLPVNTIPAVPKVSYAVGTINPQVGSGGAFCVHDSFTIVGTPSGGVFNSSNASTASVGAATGKVKILAVGSTNITYTYTTPTGCSNSQNFIGVVAANCPGHRGVVNNNEQLVSSNEFTMYPNPAKSVISLSVKTLVGSGSIVVTDLYGKQVKNQVLSMGNNTVDISNLAKGFYLVNIITEQGKTTKKLVVE